MEMAEAFCNPDSSVWEFEQDAGHFLVLLVVLILDILINV